MQVSNNKNLVPFTVETAREKGANGGRASKATKLRRKAFKEVFSTLLNNSLSDDLAASINKKSSALGINTDGFTVNDYMALAQIVKAVGGDTKAFEVIRDTVGEKPTDKQELSITDIPKINIVKGGDNGK